MLILSPPLLDALAAASVHIINLHPALPGEYNGVRRPSLFSVRRQPR